jgi:hypothetical protein
MKNSWIGNPNGGNMLMLLHVEIFVLRNSKILIFGGISKFHLWTNFGIFGSFAQFWVDLGRICYIESG